MNEQQLIAEIYRAGLRHAWPAVLESVTRSLDSSFLQLVGVSKATGRLAFSLHSEGEPADGMLDYLRAYHAVDPHASDLGRLPVGTLLNNHRVSEQSLLHMRYYRDFWMCYADWHVLAGKLIDNAEVTVSMELVRGPDRKAFSEPEERRVQRLMKHLAVAAEALWEAQQQQASSVVGELLLQRSCRPRLLLGTDGSILFANGAAKWLLGAETVLVDRSGYVCAACERSDARLKSALSALCSNAGGNGGNGGNGSNGATRAALGLRDTAHGRAIVPACLWSLGAREFPGTVAPAAGLLVVAAAADPAAPDPVVLGTIFDFTPGEARVACCLLRSQPPKAIASVLGLSIATVRHHIRRLLLKTGSRDLRDLTRQITLALDVESM